MKSIRMKITINIVAVVAVVSISFALLSYLVFRDTLTDVQESNLETIAYEVTQIFDEKIDSTWSKMEILAKNETIANPAVAPEDKQAVLSKLKEDYGLHDLIYLDSKGQALIKGGTVLDLSQKVYFQESMAGKRYVTSPYQDTQDATKMIVCFTVPVVYDGTTSGVLMWMEKGEVFGSITEGIKVGETGLVFIVDQTATTIAHPDNEKVVNAENIVELANANPALSTLAEIELKGLEGNPGIGTYTYAGVSKMLAYCTIESTGWAVFASLPVDEALAGLYSIINAIMIIAAFMLIVSFVVSLFIAATIANPIKKLTEIIAVISKGDFTAEVSPKLIKHKDEVGKIAANILGLKENLGGMIRNISEATLELKNVSEGLDKNTDDAKTSMDEIDTAVQEIANGATYQSQETMEATEHVLHMGERVDDTKKQTELLNISVDDMKSAGEEENDILIALNDINFKVKNSIDEIYNQTNATNDSVIEIHNAVSIIAAIADETSLLSLNASIEAARAGENGRGFAVVAEQIGKLAEQSDTSAKQIENIIMGLSKESAKSVDIMNEVKLVIEQQNEKVEKTGNIFERLKKGINEVTEAVGKIAVSVDELTGSRKKVNDCVQTLSSISQENAASTEETSASTTEVSTIMKEIANSTEELKHMAGRLEGLVAEFKC